ncbi:hypothetical protein [Klebsiella pneumoniae]|uniref:hypothetical protein n=1 Tax=Klebsiella pneumoniae TaxID=573 RepID=UPI0022B631B3|nr:hypothetical protein [Klebsiella pneumoniae]
MIVKFHPRGRRQCRSRWIICGKDRQRDGAIVLQGKPEEVGSLSTPRPTPKVHLRRLSFAEQDLPPGQREKLMASFERF